MYRNPQASSARSEGVLIAPLIRKTLVGVIILGALVLAPVAGAKTRHCANHPDPWHTAIIRHEHVTDISCARAAPLCISYNIPQAPEPYDYHGQLWLFRLHSVIRDNTFMYEHVTVRREHSNQSIAFDAYPQMNAQVIE
jgi:hypothetical protein